MSSYDEHLISMAGGDGEPDRGDNSDQPPEVDVHDSSKQLPPADAAAERVREFVSWFGDGSIWHAESDDPPPPLYARDLEAIARAILEPTP